MLSSLRRVPSHPDWRPHLTRSKHRLLFQNRYIVLFHGLNIDLSVMAGGYRLTRLGGILRRLDDASFFQAFFDKYSFPSPLFATAKLTFLSEIASSLVRFFQDSSYHGIRFFVLPFYVSIHCWYISSVLLSFSFSFINVQLCQNRDVYRLILHFRQVMMLQQVSYPHISTLWRKIIAYR